MALTSGRPDPQKHGQMPDGLATAFVWRRRPAEQYTRSRH